MTIFSPLVQAFCEHLAGLCGQHDPAHIISQVPVMEERLNLLAFGIVMDVGQSNASRWSALAELHEHWVFIPSQVAYKTSLQIQSEFQRLHLKIPKHIARVWWQISRGIQGRTKGSWFALIRENQADASQLQKYLRNSQATFPVLSGPVLSIHWLDMVHRIGGVELAGWETLRMLLPNDLKSEASLFGVAEDVHPVFISAARVWKQACQKGKSGPCGLNTCPILNKITDNLSVP